LTPDIGDRYDVRVIEKRKGENVEVLEVLTDALDLIRDEDRWCRDALARTITGDHTWPNESDAYKFCARGALCQVTHTGHIWSWTQEAHEADQVLNDLSGTMFPESANHPLEADLLVWVNNELGHDAVVQVFEKAILELGGEL
jgi:hypothetical protein